MGSITSQSSRLFEMQTSNTLGKLDLFSDQLPAQLDQNEDEGKVKRLVGSNTL